MSRPSPITGPLILVLLAGGTNVLRDLTLLASRRAAGTRCPLYGWGGAR